MAEPLFKAGDEIMLSQMEHHSNIVPWQLLAGQTGAVLKVMPITDAGELEPGAYRETASAHAPGSWRSAMSPMPWAPSIP